MSTPTVVLFWTKLDAVGSLKDTLNNHVEKEPHSYPTLFPLLRKNPT